MQAEVIAGATRVLFVLYEDVGGGGIPESRRGSVPDQNTGLPYL